MSFINNKINTSLIALLFSTIYVALSFGMYRDGHYYAIILGIFFSVSVMFTKDLFSYKNILYLLIIYLILPIIYWFTPDFSWDGNAYHLLAIKDIDSSLGLAQSLTNRIDLMHYPKSAWYLGNSYYHLYHNINLSRFTVLVFYIFSLLTLYNCTKSYYTLFIGYSNFKRICIVFCISITPVYSCQFFTNYVDFILYSLIISSTSVILTYLKQKSESLLVVSIFLLSIVATVKFNGLPIALLLSAIVIYICYVNKKYWHIALLILVMTFALYDPYYLNFKDYGNIFYPIYGGQKIDVISPVSPWGVNHFDLPEIIRAVQVIFLKHGSIVSEYKYPWEIYGSEIQRLGRPDTIAGGQGLFGSVIFIMYLAYFTILLLKKEFKLALVFIAILMGSFMYPGASFARYNFFYPLLPFIFIVLRKESYITSSIILITIANIILTFLAGTMFQLLRQERYNFVLNNPGQIIVGSKIYTPQYINNKGLILDETKTGIFIRGCFESKFKIILPKNMGTICNDRLL
jgi:hypothetical protein